jgi:hypothetical protein
MDSPVTHLGIPDESLVPPKGSPEILHFQLTSGTSHPRLLHSECEISRMLRAYTLATARQQQLVNYFGPVLLAFNYEFCGLERGWNLHTSKREDRNNEFPILRHPAFQYCGDT